MITRQRNKSERKSTTTNNHNSSNRSDISMHLKNCKVVNEDSGKVNRKDKERCIATNPIVKPCHIIINDIFKEKVKSVPQTDLGDGKKVNIFKCKSKRCGLKEFVPRDKAISSCTKRTYDCITPPGTIYVDCHSANLIYLLTCMKCGLQYVGETVQQLNARFTMHRTGIKMPEKHGTCKILSNHFNVGLCKGSDYSVQILEKLEGTGRTERKAIDVGVTCHRRKREEFWMKTLRTVYPYGLNDRVNDDYMKDQENDRVGLKFPPLKRVYSRIGRGANRKGHCKLNHETFMDSLDHLLMTDIKEAMNFIRMSLTTMKKSSLKSLGDTINDFLLSKPTNFLYSQWYSVALDIIDCRTFVKPCIKPKRPVLTNVIHVNFLNKAAEMVNLSSILRDPAVLKAVPSVAKGFTPPTVVFSLNTPISSKIFNFNKFVTSLDVKSVLRNASYLPCNCADSPFRDKHHGHIISGDLRLVKDNKLRKLFTKGPKYREKKYLDWEAVENDLLASVKGCANSWCEKNGKSSLILKQWVVTVSNRIKSKILSLKASVKTEFVEEVLRKASCVRALEELQQKFVIAPIDKASGNISFICKRFYADVLVKELGLTDSSACPTYEKIDVSEKDLIDKDCETLSDRFKLVVSNESRKLPHIYWLPKLHKNPIKFRFIIAAPNCSIKPLSQTITKIFKLFYRQIEKYNSKSYFYSFIKTFWVIQNNEDVITSIRRLNKRNSIRSISTFDFSTLYTKIPHDKLLQVLYELVDFCFQGGTHEQLSISKNGARWVSKCNRKGLRFSRQLVKDALKYLLDNCYFTFGESVFKQIVGIPMGSDPAPFFANLFLYHYESMWVRNLKKTNVQKARKFRHTFRFIDDLVAINDDNLFMNNFANIYPPELELNLEASGDQVSFLDLDLTIKDKQIDIKLFDKRDSFPFSIVRLPFASSNIPSSMFYASIGAEVLRIGRVSSCPENFYTSCKAILCRAKKQGGKTNKLCKTLKKSYGRQDVLKKFGLNASVFANSLLDM